MPVWLPRCQPGHSVLTDNSVRFVRLLRNSVSRYQEPIVVLQNQEPTSSASVFSVRFFGSTESTDPVHRQGKNHRETPDWGRMGKNEGAAWRRACASSCSSRRRRHARQGCALGSPLALACAGRHSSLPSPKPQARLAVAVTPPPSRPRRRLTLATPPPARSAATLGSRSRRRELAIGLGFGVTCSRDVESRVCPSGGGGLTG